MNLFYKILLIIGALFLAGVLQQSMVFSQPLFGVRPYFLLAIAAPFCLAYSTNSAILVGCFAGLIQGGLVGANMSAYMISFMVAAFLTSLITHFKIELTGTSVGFLSALMTIFAQGILLIIAPPKLILISLGATIGSALYNGVISLLVYSLLQKAFRPKAAWE